MKKATLGKNGRIVIPKSYREEMNIEEGSPLIISFEKGDVIVRQDKTACVLCGAFLKDNRTLRLCDKCVSEAVRFHSSK
mgnify:CR=1 FL=1